MTAVVVHYRFYADFAVPHPWLRRVLGRSGLGLDADGLRVRLGPWGRIRHPALTVTVSEPDLVAGAVNRIVAES